MGGGAAEPQPLGRLRRIQLHVRWDIVAELPRMIRVKKALRYLLWGLIPVLLLATGYAVSLSNLRGSTDRTTPEVTPCIALTGERDYRMEVLISPPDTAQPGDTIRIAFA